MQPALRREVSEISKRTNETRYGRKGLLLHVFRDVPSDDYEVWWNLDMDFDGVCIGAGKVRKDAVNDAYQVLSELSVILDEAADDTQAAAGGS